MDTGLGKDGYSLVGQGKIDNIIAGKPSERRTFFEEACGISKYHHKKDEAERKLNNTNDNIIRINDIVNELENQLEPLKIQSEKAKKFLVLRDELKELEVNVWLSNYYEYKSSLDKIKADFENSGKALEDTNKKMEALDNKIIELTNLARDLQEETDKLTENKYNLEYNIRIYENQIEISENNISHENENIKRLQSEHNELEKRISQYDSTKAEFLKTIEALKAEKEEAEAKVNELTEKLNAILNDINSHDSKLSSFRLKLSELNGQLINKKALKSSIGTSLSEIKERIEASVEGEKEKKERKDSINEEIRVITEKIDKVTEKEEENKKKLSKENNKKSASDGEEFTLKEKKTQIFDELSRANGRIEMLKDMESNFSGSPKGVKELLTVKPEGAKLYGTVVSLIRTDSEYAKAIDSALGGASGNIVCENEQDAKASINYLKKNKLGRITFMPLSTVKGQSPLKENLKGEKGFVGMASELVTYDKKYEKIVESLLLRVAVFKDMDSAVIATKKFNHSFKAVTLTGELFNIGGSITGGEHKNNLGGMQRQAEISDLEKKQVSLEKELKSINEELENKAKEITLICDSILKAEEEGKLINQEKIELLSALKYQKELFYTISEDTEKLIKEREELEKRITAKKEEEKAIDKEIDAISLEMSAVEEKIGETDKDFSKVTKKRDELNNLIAEARFTVSEKLKDLGYEEDKIKLIEEEKKGYLSECEQKIKLIKEAKEKIDDIKEEIEFRKSQIADSKESISECEEKIKANKAKKEASEKELSESQKESKALREKFILENEAHTKLEVKFNKIDSDIEAIINNLWDSYELTVTLAEELKKDIGPIPQATRKISEIKNKIKALGNINIDAIEEYKRVSERYEFLTNQRNDLLEAKENLETIISDMVKLMKEIFSKQFKLIADSFNETYIELFGGGRGELKLTDPENILESGIEIEVQPPGKKLTTISLLSGGEKAFTAIALLFAIIKVKPTPFCLFDEIEAALDDNNVYRYAEYLEKFKASTQFIVITHRRGTMEAADTLYGVTMQEKGVSKLLSLNIDEIEQEGMKN